MHRKQPISSSLYNFLYPNPRPEDPTSFSAHLAKNLVPEVRIETATFYGSLDTVEARYPGLNYSFPPHRKRLGRFPHHARLFKAFDALGLTESEIAGFCRWEGTLWARQRYEKDEGIKVQDTTGMDIPRWVDPRKRRSNTQHQHRHRYEQDPQHQIKVKTEIEVEIAQSQAAAAAAASAAAALTDAEMKDGEEEGEVDVRHSVGLQLNQRLVAAAAAREQGVGVVMDSEWEQWLKDAVERGALNDPSGALAQQLLARGPAYAAQYIQRTPGRRPSSTASSSLRRPAPP